MTPSPPSINFNARSMLLVRDAARVAEVSPDYLSRLCRSGVIAGHKLSTTWLIAEDSLHDFLRARAQRKDALRQELRARRLAERAAHI